MYGFVGLPVVCQRASMRIINFFSVCVCVFFLGGFVGLALTMVIDKLVVCCRATMLSHRNEELAAHFRESFAVISCR